MKLPFAALVLCACATMSPMPEPEGASADAGVSQACQTTYDTCLNGCFERPNYKVNSQECDRTLTGGVCPRASQPVDTVAAASCFSACDTNAKLCR